MTEIDEFAGPTPARPGGMEGVGPVAAAGQVSRDRVPDGAHLCRARAMSTRLS